jgi:hypothetical protein
MFAKLFFNKRMNQRMKKRKIYRDPQECSPLLRPAPSSLDSGKTKLQDKTKREPPNTQDNKKKERDLLKDRRKSTQAHQQTSRHTTQTPPHTHPSPAPNVVPPKPPWKPPRTPTHPFILLSQGPRQNSAIPKQRHHQEHHQHKHRKKGSETGIENNISPPQGALNRTQAPHAPQSLQQTRLANPTTSPFTGKPCAYKAANKLHKRLTHQYTADLLPKGNTRNTYQTVKDRQEPNQGLTSPEQRTQAHKAYTKQPPTPKSNETRDKRPQQTPTQKISHKKMAADENKKRKATFSPPQANQQPTEQATSSSHQPHEPSPSPSRSRPPPPNLPLSDTSSSTDSPLHPPIDFEPGAADVSMDTAKDTKNKKTKLPPIPKQKEC